MNDQDWFRLVMVSWLCVLAVFSSPSAGVAADQDQEGSGRTEQSSEEARGGRENLAHIKKACEEDIKKVCPQIRPGGGRILQCLQGQPSHLSPACRQVLEPRSANP